MYICVCEDKFATFSINSAQFALNRANLNKITCLGANFRAFTRSMKSVLRPLNTISNIVPNKVV